jgi:hypothetical protein
MLVGHDTVGYGCLVWLFLRSVFAKIKRTEGIHFELIWWNIRPILAVLPLRGRIRANFGLVRVSGKNPKQRPSRSPDTNPEYPRAALGCLEKNSRPTQTLIYIFNS